MRKVNRENILATYEAALKLFGEANVKYPHQMLSIQMGLLYSFLKKFPEVEKCYPMFGDKSSKKLHIGANGENYTIFTVEGEGRFISNGYPAKVLSFNAIPKGAKLSELFKDEQ